MTRAFPKVAGSRKHARAGLVAELPSVLLALGITLVLRSAERLSVLRNPRATLLGGGGVIVVLFTQLNAAHAPTTLNLLCANRYQIFQLVIIALQGFA